MSNLEPALEKGVSFLPRGPVARSFQEKCVEANLFEGFSSSFERFFLFWQ